MMVVTRCLALVLLSPVDEGAEGSKGIQFGVEGGNMATAKQRTAARRNIKKAAGAAKRKRTIAHLPKRTRRALSKQAAKTARRKRRAA
jgi:hypothetical protein